MAINLSNLVGNGPVFSATGTTIQSISQSTQTKLQFNTILVDTNNNYNNSTYIYTPTVAGYYQINAMVQTGFTLSNGANVQLIIYKNGSAVDYSVFVNTSNTIQYLTLFVNGIYQMNGTSDNVSIYAYMDSFGATGSRQALLTFSNFTASLIYRT
jgi:hypothetical protein